MLSGNGDRDLYINNAGLVRAKAIPDWSTVGNNLSGSYPAFIGTLNAVDLIFKTEAANTNINSERMRITSTGQVGIGTAIISAGVKLGVSGNSYFNGTTYLGIDPSTVTLATGTTPYKVLVGGKLGANEIWCSAGTPWPDYVFKEDYKLKSFDELETFITKEKHLPGLPSASEIASQDKINLGDMLVKILEKTEENTLYILQLKKQNDELRKENIKLDKLISKCYLK